MCPKPKKLSHPSDQRLDDYAKAVEDHSDKNTVNTAPTVEKRGRERRNSKKPSEKSLKKDSKGGASCE